MFSKIERLISYRNLRPQKKEGFLKVISIFSFFGIFLGVAVLIIVMSVMNGFKTDLTNKILGFNSHIVIKPYSNSIDEDLKSEIKKITNKSNLNEVYTGEAVILNNDNLKGILIKGINFTNDKSNFIKDKLIDGSINYNEEEVIIGKNLAINLNVVVGDEISIMSSSFINTPFGGFPNQQKFKITGVFDSGFYEYDSNVIFLDLDNTLNFFNKTNKDINLEIFLEEPTKANLVRNQIQNLSTDIEVYSWADLNKTFFNALKVERNVMFIILSLIIIVAAFNIISGLTILIKNKTREIAILETLGMKKTSLIRIYFFTGFLIGLSAVITGTLAGILFSINIEKIRIFLFNIFGIEVFPQDVYFIDQIPSQIDLGSISLILICSLAVCSLASLLPAIRILKMSTAKALKYE